MTHVFQTRLWKGLDSVFLRLDRVLEGDDPTLPDPLFVLGAPRSGTTLAYQLFSCALDVTYVPRLMNATFMVPNATMRSMRNRLKLPTDFKSERGRVAGWSTPAEHSRMWYRWLPPRTDGFGDRRIAPKQIEDMRRTIRSLSAICGRPLLAKNLYLAADLPSLARAFPTARVVHVTRDPLLTCQSIIKVRNNLRKLDQWWSVPIPDQGTLLAQPLWKQAVRQVVTIRSDIEQFGRTIGDDRYIGIEYENLCTDPRAELRRLVDWASVGGYKPRTNGLRDVPESFAISTSMMLDSAVAKAIRHELHKA